MEIGPSVWLLGRERSMTMADGPRMIPLMGVCYMMQYIDKLALSQAALLGLRQDLVRSLLCTHSNADPGHRNWRGVSIRGRPLFFTSVI